MNRQALHSLFLITALLPVVFCGCTSNDDDHRNPATVNTNANPHGQHPEAGRLEIPHLKGGYQNMFLVKRVVGYGINFCIEWDIVKKAQRWTAFRWDKSYHDDNIGRTEAWSEDFDIPEFYRTNREDFYSGSGYTRGHMIASEDRQQRPIALNEQTFLYSNMQPQLYDFNGGIWAKLEAKVRSWNNDAFRDTLYVCKGGTIDNSSQILEIVRKNTAYQLLVPKYFFMAVLCKDPRSTTNGGYKAIGFFLEHRRDYADEKNVAPYIVSIDELERLTGIDFFCNLPDLYEEAAESAVVRTAWGFR
ncbi:MAG: DNA/RNA non-specific endonuclease [Bacteroidaceae bacterium]|nr:DNA/RNA non-specific endonuclease [Bacteroidaceae bacterium]